MRWIRGTVHLASRARLAEAHPSRPPLAPRLALALGSALALLVAPLVLAFSLPPSQPGRSVYDLAGIWSSSTIASAEQTATRLRSQTGVEMAILSIPTGLSSVDTGTAEADARQVMDTWGVGKAGVNNGIVVLFDLDTSLRHGQIYVYGGSGIISTYLSADAAQHVANDMLAQAKAGDLNGALTVGMGEIADAVDHPGTRLESAPLLPLPVILVIVLEVGVVAVAAAVWWRSGRDAPIPLIDDSVLLPAPPPGLTPSMAALLRDTVATQNALPAALVDLSSRNLLAMREGTTPLGIGRKPIDFVTSNPGDPLVVQAETGIGEPERVLLAGLRSIAQDGLVEHTQLAHTPRIRTNFSSALGKAAAASPWYRSDPNASVNHLAWAPIVPIVAAVLAFMASGDGMTGAGAFVTIAATIVAAVIGGLLARSMASRTPEGSWVLGMALAYRNTIRHEIGQAPGVVSAQQHVQLKMPWLGTPDALIVWSIALGLADEIGALLTRSVDDPASASWHPVWYAGSAASFASFGSSIASITTTAASSGGGGYGGGGSGGGGGGGGGF